MANNTLASTTFASGPDDTMAVADIYTISEPGVINSIDDNSNALDKLLERNSSVSDLSGGDPDDIYNIEIANRSISETEKVTRITDVGTGIGSAYRSVSSAVKSAIKINPILGRVVQATLGNKASNILSKHLGDARVITTMIDKFTNGGYKVDFTDKGALSGLVAGLASEGSRLGLPDTFTKIASTINNRGVLMAAATTLLPKVAKAGNIDLLRDIANSSIGKDIKKIMPNIIPESLSNFSLSSSTPKKDYAAKYDFIKGAFTTIDSGWNTIKRNGDSTLSGLSIAGSKSFGDLLSAKVMAQGHEVITADYNYTSTGTTHNEDEKYLLVAKDNATTVDACLKSAFPTINIASDLDVSKYENTDVMFA